MRRRAHGRLFVIGAVAWVTFWVLGLPSYYQQYSTRVMVAFDAILLIGMACLVPRVLRRTPGECRMNVSFCMAFYFTVPFAVYDWLYCGVYLGHGAGFLWQYWYLTVFYFIPWLLLPGTAYALERLEGPG